MIYDWIVFGLNHSLRRKLFDLSICLQKLETDQENWFVIFILTKMQPGSIKR